MMMKRGSGYTCWINKLLVVLGFLRCKRAELGMGVDRNYEGLLC